MTPKKILRTVIVCLISIVAISYLVNKKLSNNSKVALEYLSAYNWIIRSNIVSKDSLYRSLAILELANNYPDNINFNSACDGIYFIKLTNDSGKLVINRAHKFNVGDEIEINFANATIKIYRNDIVHSLTFEELIINDKSVYGDFERLQGDIKCN